MIIPLVQSATRHHLAVETDDNDAPRGVASVEITHTREVMAARERVSVFVTVDDPDSVIVACEVRAA